jgi:pimeloyl-ACP methyl ester carboxylesterase
MKFTTRLIRWLLILLAGYLILMCWTMWMESSMVYPAPRGGQALAARFGAEDLQFLSGDGTRLHAWYFARPQASREIVFFHGNAESIENSGPWIGRFAGSLNASVLIFDYRGYGLSDGKPYERGLVQDGVAAVDWLVRRTGKSSDQFVYLGRSLGAAVAVQVARQRPARAFLLVSSFSSMVDLAAELCWWLPVRKLMRNRYEAAQDLAHLDIPLLQIHGSADRIIPIRWGRQLFEVSPTPHKQFLVAEGRGHNDLALEAFRDEIDAFLDR